MNKVIFGLSLFLILFSVNTYADTIYMNDGTVKQGKIKRENTFSYTLIIDGKEERVFKDQVKSVDREVEKNEPSELLKQLEKEGYIGEYELENPEMLTDEKKDLIKELLEINGTTALLQSNKQEMLKKAPADQFSKINELLNLDDLTNEIIPIYAKHYSTEDLKQILGFYKSSAGQKVINSTSIIMQEVVQSTVLYFQKHLKNQ